MKIWGNTIVKNEDRYLWFAVKSVVDFLDKILVWDTGSSDNTVPIIKLLQKQYPKKIVFEEIGSVNADGLTKARQEMLDQTLSDWLLILDGDEVWWKSSIKKTMEVMQKQGDNLYALVNPVVNVIGDIYHYQEEAAGRYQILGKKGHLNIRAINRKISGIHIKNQYPLEGFYDKHENLIQEVDEKLIFVDAPLLHFTHLVRSSKLLEDRQTMGRSKKTKYELGIPFAKDFNYPEVLYLDKPSIVLSPWVKMTTSYKLRAAFETPLKRLKRKLDE